MGLWDHHSGEPSGVSRSRKVVRLSVIMRLKVMLGHVERIWRVVVLASSKESALLHIGHFGL